MKVAESGDEIAGRYRLGKILGEGGMGAVFEATQMNLNREVAIKLMHPEFGMKKDSRMRFEREARVSAALHHPNAVKIFDFGDDDGRLFLVMEKLYGDSLRALVDHDKPPLPHGRSVSIGLQTAEVLIAAHKISLVHRDLKPENIFLETNTDGTDRVVVVDFGLAFIEEREDTSRMTQEGMIMGTPAYMSPEQATSQTVGPPADIYAFGCMMYEMITATTPFEGAPMIILSQHIFQAPVALRDRQKDLYIPSALENLVLGMLAKLPEDRPTAEGVAKALGQLEHTLGERERARGREHLQGRAARMIPTVRESVPEYLEGQEIKSAEPRISRDVGAVVAIVGEMDEASILGLRANGYAPVIVARPDEMPDHPVAIFAPNADDAVLKHLLMFGPPVIADNETSDMDRVAKLLALGIADVVGRPLKVQQLAKKLKRAVKRAARKSKS